jgi:thiol-disulfide isomerase/thioredoxin
MFGLAAGQTATEMPVQTHAEGAAPPTREAKQIISRLQAPTGQLTVVNFWATWCKPCIKEMPYFEQLGADYADKGLKVLLVSNDLTDHIQSQLVPFIEKMKLKNEVVIIKQTNAADWIGLFDASWSGAIPATLLVNGEGKFVAFFEGEFPTYQAIQDFVKPHLKALPKP